MKQLMVVLMLIWGATAVPMMADSAVSHTEEDNGVSPSTSIVIIDDEGRRHQYIRSPITGKAERIYPYLNALDFSGGKEITSSNVEQVARKVLAEIEEFSHVDHDKLTFLRARKSKLGMWLVSFEQIHRGFLVYGARYEMTIGRNNTVLVVGGDVYDITSVQNQGTVSEDAGPTDHDLGGLLDEGPAGGTVDDSDLEVNPTITSSQVVADLLGNDTTAVIVDEPTLVIYPDIGETNIAYKVGWVASVDYVNSSDDSRQVVVDAFSGETLFSENLWVNYSRNGRVRGPIYPEYWNDTRVEKDFRDLTAEVRTLNASVVASDQTDASGRYSLNWTSAPGHFLLGAELEGMYIQDVKDDDNSDLSHWLNFSVPPSNATHDWTWSNNIQYADQINIFYHTNKVARWFDASDFYDVDHKVELVANRGISGAYARCYGRSVPRIVFSDSYDSERQAGVIYHEYTHSVSYAMHGSFLGSSGEAEVLEESMADYFAQTILGHKYVDIPNSNKYDTLDNNYNYANYNTLTKVKRGLIGAGAAWRLRSDIGAQDTDEIIFGAFEMTPRPTTFRKYFDNVLKADDDINGNGYWSFESCDHGWGDTSPHAGEIWDAFSVHHGIPSDMLDEDPDCSPKALANPVASSLERAYPNPFNSSVSLRYRIDEPGKVDVAVYSLTGQLVRHLSSDKAAVPGSYSISWDGLLDNGFTASSGVYFLRVRQPNHIRSFKITFLK